MKNYARMVVLGLILTVLLALLSVVNIVLAQNPTTTRTPGGTSTPSRTPTDTATPVPITTGRPTVVAGPYLAQDITLANLRVRNMELISEGSVQFTIRIPDNWIPGGNNVLNLSLEYITVGQSNLQGTTGAPPNAVLEVRLDNELMTAITLVPTAAGGRTYAIPLRQTIMNNPGRKYHTIRLSLNTRDDCLSTFESRVVISNAQSFFHFEYREVPPPLDLGLYPRPFYNSPIGGVTESVLIVLPPQYTTNDLEAAASLSAGLGQMTSNSLQIRVTTADQLKDDDLQNNNLMLVGQIGTHPLLDSYYRDNLFPTRLEGNGSLSVRNQAVAQDDGVAQIILNPKNPMRVVLAVTGRTPASILKASRALAGPPSLLRIGGSLALIASGQPFALPQAKPLVNDRLTLGDLGYTDAVLSGAGSQSISVSFFLPAGAPIDNNAYVELHFDYSDTLREALAVISMDVNGTPLNSVSIGALSLRGAAPTRAASATGVRVLRGSIVPSSLRLGQTNTLTITLDIQNDSNCARSLPAVLWVSVRSDSEIYLPRTAARTTPKVLVSAFPAPFNTASDLHDVWVSLPAAPTMADIEQGLRILSRLGSETDTGLQFVPRVSLGEPPQNTERAAYHFVVLGLPTTNPFLAALNDQLPQPFKPGSNELQPIGEVVYRLPPDFSIGVLQTLRSPWSTGREILVITGTTAAGQANAANVLLSLNYDPSDLQGDVVFANANAISTVNVSQIQDTDAATPTARPASVIRTGSGESGSQPTPNTGNNVPVFTVTPFPTASPAPTDAKW
ncbi:MAG: cellulose biosynthesis cyclic di-GMP-binding regulatory protein BcsB [Anaerolineae bacterium]|nr:cellulose biosynthesis cyclic di-GMP-binding regulatory protein BcsB [Anaerolineae bacterium]